ncbi:MAG: NAD-dependent epimerase/dehydratase [Candidatus Woesebacteria bacterium GW2011_GWB1_45_5]|uniref:UDP-glucuronate decarboxylase n=1 Tax=Candidatus Woesebacteria bacterium GW2011_GWB1_45_5 TaxID=1618581 RepID=A0A0G1MRF7_9BACT|nr:MAG: NAD-dependent epimerase/dehydratase [Candidatus Woesebacteria bacterium GW2011_GWB1_45_5]
MQNILVTGGAGFIGSHLCGLLVEKGYKTICVDNLITGSKKNIEHLLGNPNFQFLEGDITKPLDSEPSELDYIFHLASPASPIDYQNHPEETLLVNSMGTLNMLKMAKEKDAKILIASTSEIYGDPLEHPQKESYWGNVNSFGPRACYDESKRFAEAATYVYLNKYGIDARIIRIFNTYGPRMQVQDGRVVSNFINQCLKNESLTVYGDGSQTRSFCYVSDMAAGIMSAMFSENTRGEIFNLGNPEEYTVNDLAAKIKEMTNSPSEIVYKPLPPDDPKQRQPDISKAKDILSWEPKVPVSEGLAKTIEYYKSIV